MGFKYDFDMFSVIPDVVRQEFQGMLDEVGMGDIMGEQVALFRDPELASALQTADEEVKNLFLNSGFGLNTYHSGAPEGRYPGRDEGARNACVLRLAENIAEAGNLDDANWGGFSLDEFLEHLALAEPIDEVEMTTVPAAEALPRKKASLARIGLMAGGAMVAASTVGIALRAIAG